MSYVLQIFGHKKKVVNIFNVWPIVGDRWKAKEWPMLWYECVYRTSWQQLYMMYHDRSCVIIVVQLFPNVMLHYIMSLLCDMRLYHQVVLCCIIFCNVTLFIFSHHVLSYCLVAGIANMTCHSYLVSCHLSLGRAVSWCCGRSCHIMSQHPPLSVGFLIELTQCLLHVNISCSELLMKCPWGPHYFSLGRGVIADVLVWNKKQISTVMDWQFFPVAVN